MKDSAVRAAVTSTREFPALLMTLLFVGAALASTGCLRQIVRDSDQALPVYWGMADDVQYFAPGPEFQLTQEIAAKENRNSR